MIGSCITFRVFPSKFSKFCFYMCIPFNWLVAFSLAFAVLFLLLTSFTVCHAILDYLSSTKCLILQIWFFMYSLCDFRYTLVNSFRAFLSFWALVLVGFHLLHWAYLSFESVSANHQIVMAKIRLSLWKNVTQTTTTIQYDCSLLNNRDIRDKYTLTLRNKFDAPQEISETHTPNDK